MFAKFIIILAAFFAICFAAPLTSGGTKQHAIVVRPNVTLAKTCEYWTNDCKSRGKALGMQSHSSCKPSNEKHGELESAIVTCSWGNKQQVIDGARLVIHAIDGDWIPCHTN